MKYIDFKIQNSELFWKYGSGYVQHRSFKMPPRKKNKYYLKPSSHYKYQVQQIKTFETQTLGNLQARPAFSISWIFKNTNLKIY